MDDGWVTEWSTCDWIGLIMIMTYILHDCIGDTILSVTCSKECDVIGKMTSEFWK
jgi:hypothetical protein